LAPYILGVGLIWFEAMGMRILVVGAGSIGGYFGGRLLEAGRDVTFLVRPRRAAQLVATGLVIRGSQGDVTLPRPATTLAAEIKAPFDVVLLSCKAYDLKSAMDDFAPAVGAETAVLPLLNGMAHLPALDARFGAARILGGLCLISTVLDADGRILHLNEAHQISFGERDGTRSARAQAIESAFRGAKFQARHSDNILQEMWEKWVFIASAAGITCLLRASIGDIVAAGAAQLAEALLAECASIATREGFAPSADSMRAGGAMLQARASALTASMLRDIERGAPIEVDQILGDLLRRAVQHEDEWSILRIACAHARAYEARRLRENRAVNTI
jgi:2-dehydropantoate 2-reductase